MKNSIRKRSLQLMACLSLAIATIGTVQADYLPNNSWPNAAFEAGTGLDTMTGTPTHWNRGGSDGTICVVVTNNYVSPTHSLALVDNDPANYGEWYSDYVSLSGVANPGDILNLLWYEMYSIVDGEMRLHILFADGSGGVISDQNHVVSGDSAGWAGTIDASTFTKRNQSVVVPTGAVQFRILLTSGGPSATTGTMVIDDLSIARSPTPQLLTGNFWPNPSFELGTSLDDPTGGTLSNWHRGGSLASIDQITTNNYVSSGHALAAIDNDPNNYGEWYSDQISLAGHAVPGNTLTLQWFELYSISNGEMRLTFTFYDASGSALGDIHFVANGNSAGWQGRIAGSGFTKRVQQVLVPANGAKLLAHLVSGGPSSTVGVMIVDDLSVSAPPPPPLLAGNFWPNPTFESGSNLNRTNGLPSGWVAAGGDPTIDQVTTNLYNSPTHALAIVDNNPNDYGEWGADLLLGTNARAGDSLNIQWYEVYSVTNGPMRVSVLFFDANTNLLAQTDATADGNSAGWAGQLAGSTFTAHQLQAMIPYGAALMRIALVSGGPVSATGIYLLDDLSVARIAYPSTILSYDFFPNPTFEIGAQLDNPTLALPAGGWLRGGSSASIDEVLTNTSVSPTHSLALVDNDSSKYGEWYLFLNTSQYIGDNDAVDIQWFELYSITNGNMRLSVAFLDSGNNTLAGTDFNAMGDSPGWSGALANSSFTQRFERLTVPPGTTRMRFNFASGGSASVTGLMLIDDLSIRKSLPWITALTANATGGYEITWNSMASKTYTVLYTGSLSGTPSWTPLTTGFLSGGLTTTYSDNAAHSGEAAFYRIIQE